MTIESDSAKAPGDHLRRTAGLRDHAVRAPIGGEWRFVNGSDDGLCLRFLSGPDIDDLAQTPSEVFAVAADLVAADGRGETVFEPPTRLVLDNDGRG